MIEVTEDDLVGVMKQLRADNKGWVADAVEVEKYSAIIAAAYEVMRKKHGDTLADAVKEALKSNCRVTLLSEGRTVVAVAYKEKSSQRFISLDDNFPALAAAAVRQLAKQVRQ